MHDAPAAIGARVAVGKGVSVFMAVEVIVLVGVKVPVDFAACGVWVEVDTTTLFAPRLVGVEVGAADAPREPTPIAPQQHMIRNATPAKAYGCFFAGAFAG